MFSLFMGKGDSSESPFFGVNRACVVIVLYFSVLFDAGFSEGGIGRHGSLAFNEDAVDDYPWTKGFGVVQTAVVFGIDADVAAVFSKNVLPCFGICGGIVHVNLQAVLLV